MINNESNDQQINHSSTSVKENPVKQSSTDSGPFINSSLLLGQSFPYNSISTGTFIATPGERIPSIKSFTSNSNTFGSFTNNFSANKSHNDASSTGVVADSSITANDHTWGQMEEQRTRADVKSKTITNTPDGNDNDEYDEDDDEGMQLPVGNESTGRWTRNEHEMFLEALKKYGKVIIQ